jgi:hypothetical protein
VTMATLTKIQFNLIHDVRVMIFLEHFNHCSKFDDIGLPWTYYIHLWHSNGAFLNKKLFHKPEVVLIYTLQCGFRIELALL